MNFVPGQFTRDSTRSLNVVYQATEGDGFVCLTASNGYGSTSVSIYTDANNPPTTQYTSVSIDNSGGSGAAITIPIKKNEYWKAVVSQGTLSGLFWMYYA